MLKQRVITALVLLAILLPALFYPSPVPFAIVVLVLMAAGAWEWGRLNGWGQLGSLALGAVCVLLCGAGAGLGWLERPLTSVWVVGGAVWVLGGAALLRAGVLGWPRVPAAVRLVVGVLALWLAWLAVVQARMVGINFLLSVLALVWVADISAYFAGTHLACALPKTNWRQPLAPAKAGKACGAVLSACCCWRWSGWR